MLSLNMSFHVSAQKSTKKLAFYQVVQLSWRIQISVIFPWWKLVYYSSTGMSFIKSKAVGQMQYISEISMYKSYNMLNSRTDNSRMDIFLTLRTPFHSYYRQSLSLPISINNNVNVYYDIKMHFCSSHSCQSKTEKQI